MRTLVIGDVHGCFTALSGVLKAAEYRLRDHLIFLGDLVDRGPQSKEVLDWVCTRHNVTVLRGNHERMMIDARNRYLDLQFWMMCGGAETIQSYGPLDNGWAERVSDTHWDLINEAPLYLETDDTIYVHATPNPKVELSQQTEDTLLWSKLQTTIEPHCSGKRVICGHTSQKDGGILDLGHITCIDTYVYADGWLTCLDPDTGEWYQANQNGDTRMGQLDD